KQRYYRLVLPMDPDKPGLSSHPLTWTTISHVIWDGQAPDVLSLSQQQALLDWLHWGGQLIITGGAGQPYPLYRESFLGPYLPADATGESVGLTGSDLNPLSQSYRPTSSSFVQSPDDPDSERRSSQPVEAPGEVYQSPAPIHTASNRPVYLS